MAWQVVVLLVLLGTLLLVCIVAFVRYWTLSRLQKSIERAWFTDGLCAGRTAALDCRLHARDDLEKPPEQVLKAEFDRKLARRLADYVARIELVANDQVLQPPGHQQVGLFKPRVGPAFGVAWLSGTTLVLAFRATVTHREIQDDLNAWQVDFDTGRRIEQPLEAHTPPDLKGPQAWVHAGFHKVYERFRDEVLATVAAHKPRLVLLCGHSLGGAVATLMALGLSESVDHSVEVGCYVFGTPRVGNGKFDERLRSSAQLKAMWRVVNKADNIQDLPLCVTPNLKRPSDRPFYYEHGGPAYEYYENWGSWRVNHFLPNYMHHLET